MKIKLQSYFVFLNVFLILQGGPVLAQNASKLWYFGQNAGVNFNGGNPVSISNGQLSTQEGCATVTTAAGTLLFYTDGITVWNKNHQVMVNGTGLWGGWSTTQSALILQLPGSATLYYIFTIEDQSMPGKFTYSIVDMSLQSGNGQVTVKNTLLANNVTEKLAAVRDISGTSAWVMTHERGNSNLQAWLMTSSGIAATPVVSAVGDPVIVNDDVVGQMKFSPDGSKVAFAFPFGNFLNLCDFNASTGVVSNFRHLDLPPISFGAYGLEFSPLSQFLYATSITAGGIFQWDVTLSTPAAIVASRLQIGFAPGGFSGSMQLGPDNKIYIAEYNLTSLGRINQPDNAGMTCNYSPGSVSTGSATVTLGLPGNVLTISAGAQLPVTLLSFTGNVNGTTNLLAWETASEKNNRCFLMQRSHDAMLFETIGKVNGAGNSSSVIHYSFSDNHPHTGLNYYRLEQMDDDGNTSFSKTISLVNHKSSFADLIVFPNPANELINLQSPMEYDHIVITDSRGNVLISTSHHNTMDVSGWGNGIYTLNAFSGTGYSSVKFSIAR